MKKALKQIIQTLYPEFVGNYHLPIKAQIVAIADAPTAPALCDQYRPHYAVDVLPLLPTGKPNKKLGIFEGLELPLMGVNYALPQIGQFVELAFFNGLPTQPFIRSIRPEGLLVPDHSPGETITSHSLESFNKIDTSGNHQRFTQGEINDEALRIISKALDYVGDYKRRNVNVTGDDSETVKGSKLIEALGLIDILAGDNLNIGTLKALAIQAKKAGISIEQALSIEAKQADIKAGKITIGDGTNELLALVKDLSVQVNTLITDLTALQVAYNTHTNPKSGSEPPPTQVTPTAANVATMQTGLDSIMS